jgi:hypothetical protein
MRCGGRRRGVSFDKNEKIVANYAISLVHVPIIRWSWPEGVAESNLFLMSK